MRPITTNLTQAVDANPSTVDFDITQLVSEHELHSLLLSGRPRSTKAKSSVIRRFADRHGLTVYKLGQTRLYRKDEWCRALTDASEARIGGVLKRLSNRCR